MNNRLFALKITLCGLLTTLLASTVLWHHTFPTLSIIWVLLIILIIYNVILRLSDITIKTPPERFDKNKAIEETSSQPYVTIIIPAHNEAKVIEETVLNILKQTYPFFDVLVMDDRSTDETSRILKTLQEKTANISQFSFVTRSQNERPGKSAVLNDALLYTQSKYLLIVDADARLPADFLGQVIPTMTTQKYGALQVQRQLHPITTGHLGAFLNFCQSIEYALDVHLQRARYKLNSAVELRGSGMLIKREALSDTQGWTIDAITDDLDLSSKLHITGWPIGFMDEPHITEQGLIHWKALYKQRLRWAQGSLERYLQYGGHLLFSRNIPLHTKLDTIVYSLSLLLPALFLIDFIYASTTFNLSLLFSIVMALVVLGIIFAISFFSCTTRLWQEVKLEKRVRLSLAGGLYMIVLWKPNIFHAYWRILTQAAPPAWEQTERL